MTYRNKPRLTIGTKNRPLSAQTCTGLTDVAHRSDQCSSASNTSSSLSLSPSRNCPHTHLGPGHPHTRLKYPIGRVVLVLRHSLLTPPLEAKLIFVAISPTIATMKLYELRLRLGMELFIWFLSTRLLNRFLLTWLLNRFVLTCLPKKHFPEVLMNLIGFWKSLVCGGNTGGESVPYMVRFRDKSIFVVGFWWLWDILTTSLTNLVCPKPLSILELICLDHYP
jgi:hypothetical protein